MIDDSTKDLLAFRLRALAADYRLELIPLKFRQTMIDSADEIERLRMEIDDHFRTRDTERLLSENGDFPEPEKGGNEDKLRVDIDHAAIGREYAENLLGEPAISRCLLAMADEIERLRE